jgi:hypothetical protein
LTNYSRVQFGNTVMRDYEVRRSGVLQESVRASAALETKALGHPDFKDLPVGRDGRFRWWRRSSTSLTSRAAVLG